MKTRKNKSLILTMSIVLALIMILAATLAWFNAKDSVTNHLETDSFTNGDVKLVEIFDEDTPLDPGTSVDKLVGVVNTGSTKAFVRVSFAEVIQKLANNGAASVVNTKYNGADNIIPQLFDGAAIASGGAYGSWTPLATGDSNFTTASLTTFLADTSGIQVRYNKTTANNKTYYQFVAYAPLSDLTGTAAKYNGKYQLVDINIKVDKNGVLSIEQIDVGGTLSKIAYYQFTQGAATNARWAELDGHSPFDTYADKIDDPAIALNPGATPPVYETVSHVDDMISLIFGNRVKTDLGECSEGDWWYNSDDGYFYYIGKLASGAQTTGWLLEGVKLDKDAGDAYGNLSYDLTPCMDAIQAVRDALTDGWGLDDSDSTIADLIALLIA